ncbi:MAG: hypothetical protein ACE5IK_10695 [Acidobacteriota bacterium]
MSVSATFQQAPPASRRLAWMALFGISFGYLEAAVVIYLRRLYYPDGFQFPLAIPEVQLGVIEVVRELTTLLMILSVAGLAARTAWGRFGAFAYLFGVWDLVFYVTLKIAIDWPPSLSTWDVLFLISGVWTGPVWSAAVVAVFLTLFGAWIVRADEQGHRPVPRPIDWIGAVISLLLLLAAFLWNDSPVSRGEVPRWFPWPVWLGGVAVGLATFVRLFVVVPRQVRD